MLSKKQIKDYLKKDLQVEDDSQLVEALQILEKDIELAKLWEEYHLFCREALDKGFVPESASLFLAWLNKKYE